MGSLLAYSFPEIGLSRKDKTQAFSSSYFYSLILRQQILYLFCLFFCFQGSLRSTVLKPKKCQVLWTRDVFAEDGGERRGNKEMGA